MYVNDYFTDKRISKSLLGHTKIGAYKHESLPWGSTLSMALCFVGLTSPILMRFVGPTLRTIVHIQKIEFSK